MLDKLTLGLRTDLMMLTPFGRLTSHFDCLQFVSPAMSGYFFGNCLVFSKPPVADDFPRWTSPFETLFADMAGIRHQTFLWPNHPFDPSDILPFTKAGFELDATVVMASAQPKARRSLGAGIVLRQVTSNADWKSVSDLQISIGLEDREYSGYSDFERCRMAVRRRLAESGKVVGLRPLRVLNWLAHLAFLLKTGWPVIRRSACIKNIAGAVSLVPCLNLRRTVSQSSINYTSLLLLLIMTVLRIGYILKADLNFIPLSMRLCARPNPNLIEPSKNIKFSEVFHLNGVVRPSTP